MGAEALYETVAAKLRSQINGGILNPGDQIPTEKELCEACGVSRITVRRAVSELEKEGILEKRQGKGTFVTTPGTGIDLREVNSFHEACRRAGVRPGTKVISVGYVKAAETDVSELKTVPGERVVETVRVRTADGVPVVLEKNRFSMAYSYLTECDLSGSLYALLREMGVEPSAAVHEISLRKTDREAAALLGVREGTPLIFLHEVIYDQKGRPLHNSDQFIRGDLFTFRV